MVRKNQLVLALLGLLLFSALAWGLYASIEFYDRTIRENWSKEAVYNPYLAAEQFLQKSDIEVIEADSLVTFDSLNHRPWLQPSDLRKDGESEKSHHAKPCALPTCGESRSKPWRTAHVLTQ